ncbi:hypothetical protein ABW20_dc0103168 [Dactylellina cionopaga]|nr:hypothetical protein ABW20_dc0103168 [Dactylellina cionopaga]
MDMPEVHKFFNFHPHRSYMMVKNGIITKYLVDAPTDPRPARSDTINFVWVDEPLISPFCSKTLQQPPQNYQIILQGSTGGPDFKGAGADDYNKSSSMLGLDNPAHILFRITLEEMIDPRAIDVLVTWYVCVKRERNASIKEWIERLWEIVKPRIRRMGKDISQKMVKITASLGRRAYYKSNSEMLVLKAFVTLS